MIVIIGASASGKTEIAKVLYNKFNYHKLVTTTTRQPREHEQDGVDYHFFTKELFEMKMKDNFFIENTKYQDNYYGIAKKDVKPGAVVIVDPNGANALIDQMKKNVFIVFIESDRTTRKERMLIRGDDLSSVVKRLSSDDLVFNTKNIKHIDLHLVNKDQTLEELASIINENYQIFMKTVR